MTAAFSWYLPQLQDLIEDDIVDVSLHVTQSGKEEEVGGDSKGSDAPLSPMTGRPHISSLLYEHADAVAGKMGVVGKLSCLSIRLKGLAPDTLLIVCGPEGMVIDTRNAAAGVELAIFSKSVLADELELFSEVFNL